MDITLDTVKIRDDYNAERRLCHVPRCEKEWSEWGECQPHENKRIRKRDCESLCESVCDPKISFCKKFIPVESEECVWNEMQRNKMIFYPMMGAIYCFCFILLCVCLCKQRKKRQKNTNSEGVDAENAKISEIEDSSSSNSEHESRAEHIIDHPSLI